MEDILSVYERPYDPLAPVICLDETNRQLIEERRISAKPGQVELVDYEYRRCGVANLFVAFEPLAAKRIVEVTESRKWVDFAAFVKTLADLHDPHAEKLVLVMDNLNIHSVASLYEAFPAPEARRIAEKLEIHYTPKHASWLNMEEIEIGVLSRQCLAKKMTSIEEMHRKVAAWQFFRNLNSFTVNWRLTAAGARIKLKKLYPVISEY
jgi:hypothetical protein